MSAARSFTPGPWEVVDCGENADVLVGTRYLGAYLSHDDALLISLAPQMLELLQHMSVCGICARQPWTDCVTGREGLELLRKLGLR